MADTDLEKVPVDSDDKWAEPSCASEKPLLEEPSCASEKPLLEEPETCDTSQTPSSPRSLRNYFLPLIIAASVVLVAVFFAVLLGLIIDDRARIAALEKSLNTRLRD